MSTDLKLEALRHAVATPGNKSTGDVIGAAEQYFAFLISNAQSAPAGKPSKPVKETPPAEAKAETPAAKVEETKVETGPTFEDVKAAVIGLVNAGNKAAGNDKTGREYAGAVLQSFGAKNVSTVKPEDYAKVLEALKAKLKSVEEEAALTG